MCFLNNQCNVDAKQIHGSRVEHLDHTHDQPNAKPPSTSSEASQKTNGDAASAIHHVDDTASNKESGTVNRAEDPADIQNKSETIDHVDYVGENQGSGIVDNEDHTEENRNAGGKKHKT